MFLHTFSPGHPRQQPLPRSHDPPDRGILFESACEGFQHGLSERRGGQRLDELYHYAGSEQVGLGIDIIFNIKTILRF